MGATETTRPTKVLLIGGTQRSGSTLLDRLLGEVPGFVAVGELRFVWSRGVVQNCLCGCGSRFLECPFWQQVGEAAFGGWDAVDAAEIVRLDRSVDRLWYLPFLLAPRLSRKFQRRLAEYCELLSRVYSAVAKVSGESIVVDSSKDPPFAFVLRHVPGIELDVLHLVRDSRGVAFSRTKRVERPEVIDRQAFMDQRHPAESSFRWMLFNTLYHFIGALGVRRIFMRYESLVESPREEVARAISAVGSSADGELRFLDGESLNLGVHHTVSGNPMRLRHGPVVLRLDQEWEEKMRPAHRRLVSFMTFPLLLRYGYLRRRAPSPQ